MRAESTAICDVVMRDGFSRCNSNIKVLNVLINKSICNDRLNLTATYEP